jgi:hypothetical protein
MSTHLPKANSDINAWICFNNFFNSKDEYLNIVLNGNEIPTVKQYSRTTLYNTDSHTISSAIATGNNEYADGDTITYLTTESIYEDGGDVELEWGTTVRGRALSAKTDGTWYLYITESYDQSDSTIGQGIYEVEKTTAATPTYDHIKNGWYHATLGHAIARFTVSSGTVSDLIILGRDVLIGDSNPQAAGLNITPGRIGQIFIDKTNTKLYFSTGTSDADDWNDSSSGAYGLTSYYDTGWVENLLNGGSTPEWRNVHLSSSGTSEGNITHGLNATLDKLLIRLLVSTDGTDANAIEVGKYSGNYSINIGWAPLYVDANNVKIQTAATYGFNAMNDSGTGTAYTTGAYYYRIVVTKLY